MFDYIYETEAEQYSFYRIPKVMFEADIFMQVSPEAKILYAVLLDRVSISLRNGWKDEQGRVFIICTIEEIRKRMRCGNKKAIALLNELENKIGLIERKRQGLCRPNLIYVKNFIRIVDSSGRRHFLKCQNDISEGVLSTFPEVPKAHANNTNKNKTYKSETDNPIYLDKDGMDNRSELRAYFKKNLEYESLYQIYPYDRETLNGILELLVDTCCSKRKQIRIAGDDKPIEVVKSVFMKLNSDHIQYVMGCLKENTTNVRNIHQYLLATLYNSCSTISPYYQAKVNHDLYGARASPSYGYDSRTGNGIRPAFQNYNYDGDESL